MTLDDSTRDAAWPGSSGRDTERWELQRCRGHCAATGRSLKNYEHALFGGKEKGSNEIKLKYKWREMFIKI